MWRTEAPGEFYTYCNANFGLAGPIIEKITGERSRSIFRRILFIPMQISGSYIPEGVLTINNWRSSTNRGWEVGPLRRMTSRE
jgi:CubicO group peptidase (beta-lactamase class C family)